MTRALLGAVFAAVGTAKLVRSRAQLEPHMSWVAHATDGQVKAIGAFEVAGAVGVTLPSTVPGAVPLRSLSAAGLALTMVGAAVTQLRMREPERVPVNVALFALAVFVARKP